MRSNEAVTLRVTRNPTSKVKTYGPCGSVTVKNLADLFCDRCIEKVARIMAQMTPADIFFATAAASGNGDLCDRCEAELDKIFPTPE